MAWMDTVFGTGPAAGPTSTWTPQQYSDWLTAFNQTPAGQAAQRARDQTVELNRKQVLDQLQMQRDQIALQQGKQVADKWYQEQQIKLMEDDHAMKREQFAVNSTFKAAELGAQFKGPRSWPSYLRASNMVAGSGMGSTLLANQPGGLGAMQSGFTPQRQSIGSVLSDFGFGGAGNGAGIFNDNVSNAQLGLTDADANQLKNYFANPNQAPAGWWESKSPDQREYLKGLMEEWGHSPDTFETRYGSTRPRQGNPLGATASGWG